MLVAGPQRGLFLACLSLGVFSLLTLDLQFAPEALASRIEAANASPASLSPASGASTPAATKRGVNAIDVPPAEPAPAASRAPLPAAARVPTIVARFDRESKEPSGMEGVRALATAMIEDHEVTIVLEGHSDTFGGEDFNHTISQQRAEWVKNRLVELGVSPERVEAVGLGATHPLRSDAPDAQAVNRRVEVRWIGR